MFKNLFFFISLFYIFSIHSYSSKKINITFGCGSRQINNDKAVRMYLIIVYDPFTDSQLRGMDSKDFFSLSKTKIASLSGVEMKYWDIFPGKSVNSYILETSKEEKKIVGIYIFANYQNSHNSKHMAKIDPSTKNIVIAFNQKSFSVLEGDDFEGTHNESDLLLLLQKEKENSETLPIKEIKTEINIDPFNLHFSEEENILKKKEDNFEVFLKTGKYNQQVYLSPNNKGINQVVFYPKIKLGEYEKKKILLAIYNIDEKPFNFEVPLSKSYLRAHGITETSTLQTKDMFEKHKRIFDTNYNYIFSLLKEEINSY